MGFRGVSWPGLEGVDCGWNLVFASCVLSRAIGVGGAKV